MTGPTAGVRRPLKHQIKLYNPKTPFSKNPVWHGPSPRVLLGDAVPEGEFCHSPCYCKAELIVSLTRQRLTPPLYNPMSVPLSWARSQNWRSTGTRSPRASEIREGTGREKLAEHQHLLGLKGYSTEGSCRDLRFNHWNLMPHKTFKWSWTV